MTFDISIDTFLSPFASSQGKEKNSFHGTTTNNSPRLKPPNTETLGPRLVEIVGVDEHMSQGKSQAQLIAQPLHFSHGKVAPNRLAKAPLEETLAKTGGGPPNQNHFELYRAWARGGWGIVITGNVAIDPTHLGTPWDVTVPTNDKDMALFKEAMKKYADAVTGRDQPSIPASSRPLGIVQLVHAGRQSMRGSGRSILTPSMAPSNVPMRTMTRLGPLGTLLDTLLWGSVTEMTIQQIEWLKNRFTLSAQLCAEAGFDGIELHASHGYILAAFLSPRTNRRTDKYGGSPENRARLLMEIVDQVRKRVPDDFLVGFKLNSCDYVQGGLSEDDALLNVKWLAEHGGVDFVEISGGNYENPTFIMENFDPDAEMEHFNIGKRTNSVAHGSVKVNGGTVAASGQDPLAKITLRTQKREAFFQNFARRCRSVVPINGRLKLLLTGGLRTRAGIASALSSDETGVDVACLGRPACVYPSLALGFMDQTISDNHPNANCTDYRIPALSQFGRIPIQLLGAGWGTFWHTLMIAQTSMGNVPNPEASLFGLLRDHANLSTNLNGKVKQWYFVLGSLIVFFFAIFGYYFV